MFEVLARIDAFCDTAPRAVAVDLGPLRLFLRDGPGRPYYARPIPGGGPVGVGDIAAMRALMRDRGVPDAFEWVDAASPTMDAAVREAGLPVDVCPVLALEQAPVEVALPPGHALRLLGPADGDLVAAEHAVRSVAAEAFGGARPGPPDAADVRQLQDDLAAGRVARALVVGPAGPVAAGAAHREGDVVELVAIATVLPARRRGLAAAVTSALAGAGRHAGADIVFLAAGDDGAARVYERVGFHCVGTCGIAEFPQAP